MLQLEQAGTVVLPLSTLVVLLILARTIMLWGEHDERAVIRPVGVVDEGRNARREETVKLTEAAIAALVFTVNEDE